VRHLDPDCRDADGQPRLKRQSADSPDFKQNCADFRHAIIDSGKIIFPDKNGTDCTGAECVDFKGRALRGSDFRGARIRSISATGADFSGVDFRGADLSGPYLSFKGAKFTGAHFEGATMAPRPESGDACIHGGLIGRSMGFLGVDLSGATFDQYTKLPCNWDRAKAEQKGMVFVSTPSGAQGSERPASSGR
jgi:uncharacterized protein YjbI with pentapeptide repeats